MANKPFEQLYDGEGIALAPNVRHRLACCDCGLVHDFVIAVPRRKAPVGFAVRRNKRATAQRRKVKS